MVCNIVGHANYSGSARFCKLFQISIFNFKIYRDLQQICGVETKKVGVVL